MAEDTPNRVKTISDPLELNSQIDSGKQNSAPRSDFFFKMRAVIFLVIKYIPIATHANGKKVATCSR
jgi:hypothetical protein